MAVSQVFFVLLHRLTGQFPIPDDIVTRIALLPPPPELLVGLSVISCNPVPIAFLQDHAQIVCLLCLTHQTCIFTASRTWPSNANANTITQYIVIPDNLAQQEVIDQMVCVLQCVFLPIMYVAPQLTK